MRIGLIARADNTGLAVQTFEFWRHMSPAKTLVIVPSWNPKLDFDPGRYPGAQIHETGYPNTLVVQDPVIDRFLDGLDIVFTCETPYNYWLYTRATERGVKTVQQLNFEFFDYLQVPGLPIPDLFAAPSLWRFADIPFPNKAYLPVPVNRDALPFRLRTSLRTLLHVAGIPAIHDRNGTQLVMQAMKLLPSDVDVRLRVRTQAEIENPCPDRVEVVHSSIRNYWDLYGNEDALIFPRKFGGLSLPMAEALSCGMPVISTAVDPQIRFLPCQSLVPAPKTMTFDVRAPIDLHEASPRAIADRIVELHRSPHLMTALSRQADAYAESISWGNLKGFYERTFQRVLNGTMPLAA